MRTDSLEAHLAVLASMISHGLEHHEITASLADQLRQRLLQMEERFCRRGSTRGLSVFAHEVLAYVRQADCSLRCGDVARGIHLSSETARAVLRELCHRQYLVAIAAENGGVVYRIKTAK